MVPAQHNTTHKVRVYSSNSSLLYPKRSAVINNICIMLVVALNIV